MKALMNDDMLKQVSVRIRSGLDKQAEIAVATGLAKSKQELFNVALEDYLRRKNHLNEVAA